MTDIPKDRNRAIHSVKEIDSDNVLRPNFGGHLKTPNTNTSLTDARIFERTAAPRQQKRQPTEQEREKESPKETENEQEDQSDLKDE